MTELLMKIVLGVLAILIAVLGVSVILLAGWLGMAAFGAGMAVWLLILCIIGCLIIASMGIELVVMGLMWSIAVVSS